MKQFNETLAVKCMNEDNEFLKELKSKAYRRQQYSYVSLMSFMFM